MACCNGSLVCLVIYLRCPVGWLPYLRLVGFCLLKGGMGLDRLVLQRPGGLGQWHQTLTRGATRPHGS